MKERRLRLSAVPEWAPHLKFWKFKERHGAAMEKSMKNINFLLTAKPVNLEHM